MKERLILRKTCCIHANDLHFATVVFPYLSKQIESGAIVKTILERNEKENIEKVIENVGANLETKEKIKEIDWEESDITKIRQTFNVLDREIKTNQKIDLIILGSNIFINKVNKALDLWFKNHMEELEKNTIEINIINCFSFEENEEIDEILNAHDCVLKTAGIEEILGKEELLKAN